MPIRMARCAGASGEVDLGCRSLRRESIRVWCWWRCSQTDMLRVAFTWRFRARFGVLRVFDRWERRHGRGWEWVVDGEGGVQTRRIRFVKDVANVPVYFFQLPKCKT